MKAAAVAFVQEKKVRPSNRTIGNRLFLQISTPQSGNEAVNPFVFTCILFGLFSSESASVHLHIQQQ